jgi:hypothetical protein
VDSVQIAVEGLARGFVVLLGQPFISGGISNSLVFIAIPLKRRNVAAQPTGTAKSGRTGG